MGKPPCCDKSNVKKGLWTAEEDAKILAYVSDHGPGNWTSIPKKAGLKRCGKSCRLRWTNYLRPDLRHENFTQEEEELIITLHSKIGSRWSLIAAHMPGRTDNDVKNLWNTKLRKKLCKMGIDPVTHKPISQILADCGIIGLPRVSNTTSTSSKSQPSGSQTSSNNITRINFLNRDLRNAFMPKPATTQTFISNSSSSTAMTTEMLPTQDGLLNSNQPTWDLFTQLQAIKFVSDASKQELLQHHFLIHGSSSPSSSSSSITCQQDNIQAAGVALPFTSQPSQSQMQDSPYPPSFNWSDFLSEDAFQALQHDYYSMSSTDSSITQTQGSMLSPIPQFEFVGAENKQCNGFADVGKHGKCIEEGYNNKMGGDPSDIYGASSGNSFVESILRRDSQMKWEFADILYDS